jgi:transposase
LAVYLLTRYSRGKAAARALLGGFAGVLVTDHYGGYNDDDRSRRQLCWAHLIRRLERIAELEHGPAASRCKRTARQCQHLLKDEASYWTFLGDPRIPLTNNAAERAIRPYVLWRKISFASQSHRGDPFRPLVMSVIETANRLGLRTSDLFRQVCTAGLSGEPITTRLPLPDPVTPQLPE